jgi:hypothetical protein
LAPGEQDPQLDYGNLIAERQEHARGLRQAELWLQSVPHAVRQRLLEFAVRCPERGCTLGDVYRLALPSGGERYLFLGRSLRQRRTPGFLNWAFPDDWSGPTVWWPVACRHGQAKLERAWLLDCLAGANGWKHAFERTEEFLAGAPEEIRRGISRRTFHPTRGAWQPTSTRSNR